MLLQGNVDQQHVRETRTDDAALGINNLYIYSKCDCTVGGVLLSILKHDHYFHIRSYSSCCHALALWISLPL